MLKTYNSLSCIALAKFNAGNIMFPETQKEKLIAVIRIAKYKKKKHGKNALEKVTRL